MVVLNSAQTAGASSTRWRETPTDSTCRMASALTFPFRDQRAIPIIGDAMTLMIDNCVAAIWLLCRYVAERGPVQGWPRSAISADRTQIAHSGLPLQVRT